MSVRITRQNQESNLDEAISASPVLIESMLLLMPEQSQPAMVTFEQRGQPMFSNTGTSNDFEHSSTLYRRSTHTGGTHRVPVPVHNASVWFNGPDMQNERSERMEKVVSSLVRRSFRPLSNYAYVPFDSILSLLSSKRRSFRMPRVPNLTSPSSRDHALHRGKDRSTLFSCTDWFRSSTRTVARLLSGESSTRPEWKQPIVRRNIKTNAMNDDRVLVQRRAVPTT